MVIPLLNNNVLFGRNCKDSQCLFFAFSVQTRTSSYILWVFMFVSVLLIMVCTKFTERSWTSQFGLFPCDYLFEEPCTPLLCFMLDFSDLIGRWIGRDLKMSHGYIKKDIKMPTAGTVHLRKEAEIAISQIGDSERDRT